MISALEHFVGEEVRTPRGPSLVTGQSSITEGIRCMLELDSIARAVSQTDT